MYFQLSRRRKLVKQALKQDPQHTSNVAIDPNTVAIAPKTLAALVAALISKNFCQSLRVTQAQYGIT
jgi:hypothetical protein